MSTVDELAAHYWDEYLRIQPTYASLIGDHRFDGELDDLSDERLENHISRLRDIRRDTAAADPSGDTLTRSLLLASIDADLAEYETEVLVGPVDAYLGPHSRLLIRVAQTSALEPGHARDLAERYAQIPRLLKQALLRHRRHVGEGRPPASAVVHRVLDQIDAYLVSPVEGDPFVNLRLPDGWDSSDEWRTHMAATVTDVIRPAFSEYRSGLVDEVAVRARPDDEPGICHITDGDEIYQRLVTRFVTIPQDPADIHDIGRTHATESLIEEYAQTGREAFGTTDTRDIFKRLRSDPALRYESADQMLSHAETIVARAWAAIDGWLGARPDGPCRVEPVPAALAKDLPPAYYLQPAPDGSRPGIYFLNTYMPETRDRFASEAVAFHEAIPGHHFDRALASRLTDLPAFRRHLSHNVHAEGWGLYSERLADEMGLYSGPVDRLGMLSADSWRAGRLVVDTGIHHHGWSRQKAVEFLRTWTAMNHPSIEQETDRYIGWPGQALSYKMGHLEIVALRRRAEDALGDRFDIVEFHDTILTSGGLTIPVLRGLIQAWIERRAS